MAIDKDNLDFLFDVLKFYDDEYGKVADNCFNEINRALKEIANDYLKMQNVRILPYGAYALRNNYQLLEPMEFYCILPSNRAILEKEKQQKERAKLKKGVKDIYRDILGNNPRAEKTAIDVAGIITNELQKYLDAEDVVYFKNNVIFVKFKLQDDIQLSINIYVAYDFENNGTLEFSKLGYKLKENPEKIMENIFQKNQMTNGNYLLLCKLIKMLELELILTHQSNIYLSNKSFFVENILYNVPDKFYANNDFNEMFKNVLNYIKQCDISSIKLPDDSGEQMFNSFGYYTNKFYNSFIKKITYIYKNVDRLIKDSIEMASKDANNNQSNNIVETEEEMPKRKIKKINKK